MPERRNKNIFVVPEYLYSEKIKTNIKYIDNFGLDVVSMVLTFSVSKTRNIWWVHVLKTPHVPFYHMTNLIYKLLYTF